MTDTARTSELCFMTAREQARLVRDREVSARELMAAHLDRIARINPQVNAIVAKLDDERCLALADEADRCLTRGEIVGPLFGLPHAFKDFEPAVGFPFTMGSPIFRATMPKELKVNAETADGLVMGMAHETLPLHGVQFHPESIASEHGHLMLGNFIELAQSWNSRAKRLH